MDTPPSALATMAAGTGVLPPGPRGRVLPTVAILRDPFTAYRQWVDRWGDPFLVRTLNGSVVVTGNPELVKILFTADPALFDPFAAETLGELVGRSSVLLLSGPDHRRERQLLMPQFHGGRMRAYGHIIRDITLRHVDGWPKDRAFAVQDGTTAITTDVIVRALVGVHDDDRVTQWRRAIEETIVGLRPALLFARLLHQPWFPPWNRYQSALCRLDELISREIVERRGHGGSGDDILTLLLAATYEDGRPMTNMAVRDELVTLMAAGHETTAVALAWALYRVHRDPAIAERVQDELATTDGAPEAVASLPYLDAVCQETLRLFPIVPDVLRLLRAPLQLGTYRIPRGCAVAAASALVHHDPKLYPEPESFRPERFLDRKLRPWELFPFGGGHRRCLGAAFAMYEMKIVLATILSRYQVVLADKGEVMPRRRNVTMGPATGVRIRIKPR